MIFGYVSHVVARTQVVRISSEVLPMAGGGQAALSKHIGPFALTLIVLEEGPCADPEVLAPAQVWSPEIHHRVCGDAQACPV